MICTKAYIKALPEDGSNVFKVEVPLMEDNTGTEAIFDALLSTPPGTYKGLSVGDVVFVTFEDDQYNNAIILGSLFTEVPVKSTTYTLVNDLKVTDAASLPPNTRFGDYTAQDIMNLYNKGGGGAGTLNDDDLKQYVQWINTETTTSEGDIIDVYADKIRVMSGQEYDALIEELGSEGVEEDINFINTLHFLWSIPGTTPTEGGDDEGGGGGGDDPTPGPDPGPDPETPEVYSCKKLVDFITNKFYRNFNTATSVDGINGVQIYSVLNAGRSPRLNSLFIGYSINSIFNIQSTSASYYYWKDATASPELSIYSQFTILPLDGKTHYGGDRLPNEWENLTSGNETLQMGDIIEFIDSSNRYIYVGIYLGTVLDKKKVVACGNNFKSDSNMPAANAYTCLLTMDELKEKINYTKYYVTRCKRSDRNG